MIEIYKATAREAKQYLDSLPALYLDKDVVISIRFKDNFKYRVKDDVLDDILERSEVETPQWELREEPKKEPKPDLKSDAIYKLHQMAFDCIYKALYELEENNHDMSVHCLDMAINSIKCKMNVKYGNSPWDPR